MTQRAAPQSSARGGQEAQWGELERALHDSDLLLEELVSHAPVAVAVADRDGLITHAAGPGRDVIGIEPSDGLGRSVFEVFRAAPEVIECFRRAAAGETFTASIEFVGRTFECWYAPLHGSGGEVTGVVSVATDVSRQREVERRLRESEARWRALSSSSSDMITVLDEDGTLRYGTPAAARILGYTDQSNIGTNVFDLVHPDDLERVLRQSAKNVRTPGVSPPLRFRMAHADGTWRWVESIGNNLLHDPDVRGTVVTTRDITEQKQAEDALRASEERFKALVQNSTDMIAVIDAEGRVCYASPASAHVMGYGADDARSISPLSIVHPDDRTVVAERVAELLSEPGATARVECRIRHANGSWRYVEAIATNLLDDPAVRGVVFNSRDITDRKAAEDQLTLHAYHDLLTGLPNRSLFLDRLGMALARGRRRPGSVAVLFLDIDRFQVINDSLGHSAGDQLLIAAAQRLESTLRPEDTVARFGGDEFTVLCEDVANELEPVAIAERIARALAEPFAVDDREVFLTTSIGIAVARHDRAEPESLLRDADAAMYRAKERGRARFEVFDEAMRSRAMERLEVANALPRAIERHELRLYYQPIIDLNEGVIVGVEALLRWNRPDGMWLPEAFVPLAEETGLIVPIGEWVLMEACRQLGEWQRRFALPASFSISVNLSAGQLGQPRLTQAIEAALREVAEPASLWLELTETALMADEDAAIATLRGFKARGVSLSVDDFGTGYSSLSYLNRLPIDALKVDRSFVSGLNSDPGDHAIAKAVVGLAHTLGLGAVAEGVETSAQLSELRTLGCDGAQGFLFSRPLPPHAVEELLETHPHW